MSLITELKRRNVFRMAGLYLVGAWLITQVAGTVLPMFGAPEWLARSIVILLAIGFVPALVISWVFELTPDGLKRDADVPPEASIAPQTGRRMDRAIIVALVLALLVMGVERFVLRGSEPLTDTTAPQSPATSTSVRGSDPLNISSKSIAVLAFTDLSPNKDQEYFSDGMAEEILNALAHVKDLKVAGRTSSFYYKGRNEDLRAIGKALGVANVLEGSVRKQGDRVRITAQLIRSEDGFHLWSESYDGDLKDVFALQEKIARAITDRLQVLLEGEQATRLVPVTTRDPQAYSLYLQATSIFDRRDAPHFPDALAALRKALELDPTYAKAHSRIATLYAAMGAYMEVDPVEANTKAIAAANAALALDPTMAEPRASLGLTYGKQLRGYLRQREEFERALALDPDDVTSNFWYGLALIMSGYTQAGTARFDHALSVDPMMPNVVRWRGAMYMHQGDNERAEQYLHRARSIGLVIAERELAEIASQRGDAAMAIAKWADGTRTMQAAMPPGSTEIIAAGIFGDAAARARAVALVDAYLAQPRHSAGMMPLSLVALGEHTRALALVTEVPASDNSDFFARLWSPSGKATRAVPEFPAFLRTMGLVELWDRHGAPDICRKSGNGEYACE